MTPLSDLRPGESGVIEELLFAADHALRFLELGLAPGERVRFIRRSPLGGPIEVEVMGVRQGIRLSDAAQIRVRRDAP
jgi:Fe2+ transport system protein FeoA